MFKTHLKITALSMMLIGTVVAASDRRDMVRNQDLPDGSQLIQADPPAVGDEAGHVIAWLDDLLIVGAPHLYDKAPFLGTGRAYVHHWNGSTLEWEYAGELSQLLPEEMLVEGAAFGFSVDIHPHTPGIARVIVGAPLALNTNNEQTGRAFVFQGGIGGWSLEQILDNPNGTLDGEYGARVAINDSFAFVTAAGELNGTGGNGNVWSQVLDRNGQAQKVPLPRTGGDVSDGFGDGLAHDGDVLLIGAPQSTVDGVMCGQAHVYHCSDELPAYLQTLNAPEQWQVPNARFGHSVAVDDTSKMSALLIGTPSLNDRIAGGAASYRLGNTWMLESLLLDSDPQPLQLLGYSVAIMDGLAIVTAPYGGLTFSGHALVFRHAPSAGEWRVDATINPELASVFDYFGASAAIGPSGIMVGSPYLDTGGEQAGGVFAYIEQEEGWQSDTRPIAPIRLARHVIAKPTWIGPEYRSFGESVAISGDEALVGDPNGDGIGRVHLYTRASDGSAWINQAAPGLEPPGGLPAGATFGHAIELDGDLAIIGAPNYNAIDQDGFAMLFHRSGGTWSNVATLNGTYADERFGWSVDIKENVGEAFIAIGATRSGDDDDGQVYIWRWDESTQTATLEATFGPNSIPKIESAFGQSVALDIDPSGDIVLAVGNATQAEPASPDGTTGAVDILRRDAGTGIWAHEQTIEPGDEFSDAYSTLAFGYDVAIEDGRLVVGAPLSGLYGTYSGDALLFSVSDRQPYTWSLESYLDNPTGRAFDLFGWCVEISNAHDQVFVSNPRSDYVGRDAGLVAVFEPDPTASWSLLDWTNTRLIIPNDAQRDDIVGYQMAVDGSTLLATATTWSNANEETDRPYVADFRIEDIVSWTNTTSPWNISDSDAWAVPPEGAETGVFSLLLSNPHRVTFDLVEWVGSLRIELDQIQLELQGVDRLVTGSVDVGAPANIRTAGLAVEWGTLHVGQDMHIGGQGNAGILSITANGVLEVNEQLFIHAGSSLQVSLTDTMDGARVQTWSKAPELGGGLRVDLGAIQDPESLSEGDRFVLISAGLAPTGGLFDAVILPGLPDGLAFDVQYGAPGRRSAGGCPAGEIEDCFGNCCPDTWLGDGWCDDGTYQYGGNDIYLNCESWLCDKGDCVDCWDDGGAWEMAIEVVSLAGLLDFGDPNSVAVDGDATGVEVVDLTGDFAEEICITFAGAPGQLVIFENDGAGGVAQQIVLVTGDDPVDITSGDFDGDGTNDLAVANNLSQDVTLYYNDDNDPSNGFTEADLNVDGPPTCLAGINANSDIYDDLVVGLDDTDSDGNGYWVIYLGDTALMPGGMSEGGGITPSGIPLGADPSNEEDQKDYIFAGNQSNGKTGVAKNAGVLLGGLTLELDEYTTGADPGGISTGDLNGDGQADLAVTSTANDTVAILRQDTVIPGDFLSAIFVPVGDTPTRITAIDFDDDGNLDLATIVQVAGEPVVRILQGDGNLSFTSVDTAEGENVVLVDAGDVSGDGVNELVTIGGGPAFRSRGIVPILSLRDVDNASCPGDFDSTGDVGIDDLLTLLGEFGSCTENCQSDIDSDNDVDIDDMLALIGVWGPCPR